MLKLYQLLERLWLIVSHLGLPLKNNDFVFNDFVYNQKVGSQWLDTEHIKIVLSPTTYKFTSADLVINNILVKRVPSF